MIVLGENNWGKYENRGGFIFVIALLFWGLNIKVQANTEKKQNTVTTVQYKFTVGSFLFQEQFKDKSTHSHHYT